MTQLGVWSVFATPIDFTKLGNPTFSPSISFAHLEFDPNDGSGKHAQSLVIILETSAGNTFTATVPANIAAGGVPFPFQSVSLAIPVWNTQTANTTTIWTVTGTPSWSIITKIYVRLTYTGAWTPVGQPVAFILDGLAIRGTQIETAVDGRASPYGEASNGRRYITFIDPVPRPQFNARPGVREVAASWLTKFKNPIIQGKMSVDITAANMGALLAARVGGQFLVTSKHYNFSAKPMRITGIHHHWQSPDTYLTMTFDITDNFYTSQVRTPENIARELSQFSAVSHGDWQQSQLQGLSTYGGYGGNIVSATNWWGSGSPQNGLSISFGSGGTAQVLGSAGLAIVIYVVATSNYGTTVTPSFPNALPTGFTISAFNPTTLVLSANVQKQTTVTLTVAAGTAAGTYLIPIIITDNSNPTNQIAANILVIVY